MKLKLNILAKQAKKAISDNSPAILTVLGVTGTMTALYLTGKASFKAADIIRQEEELRRNADDPALDNWDKVDLVWREFVPAAGIAAMTVAAIIGANHISTKRAAAFASAYSFAERGFDHYKKAVLDKVGPKKEGEIRDEVAKQQLKDHPIHKSPIIITGKGDHLCLDMQSGRYFQGDIEKVKAAVNDVNFQLLNSGGGECTLSEYWGMIGLDPTTGSGDVGWTSDKKLEAHYTSDLTTEGTPCLVITLLTQPRPLCEPLHSRNAY